MLYFDHNSTTPLDSRVADVLDQANRQQFGNASSIHRAGQNARRALEQARRGIAKVLGVSGTELVFTSGGTESNNLAIAGLLTPGTHAITSTIEHPSVLEPLRHLQSTSVDVTYIPVNSHGVVDAEQVARAIRPETVLVSIMSANNETGVIQPVMEIAATVQARRALGQSVWFHSDGVQAAGKLDLDLTRFDLFSISSHKLYAPKGFGALYVRKGVPLTPLHFGGRQERALRAGTENVAAALALECALGLFSREEQQRISELRNHFERELTTQIPDIRINAASAPRLGNTSNVLFHGISGEALLIALDMRGMCVSTGSACSSGSVEPSPVLLEMGLSPADARACIRFSFGRANTMDHVNELVTALGLATRKMRERQLV